jgi:filamentous hemagglutinin
LVAILYPRRLRELRDVTQPGIGLPDQGVPVLQSSNSTFVIETIAAGGAAFSLGASTLGNTLGDTGVTGTRVVLAGIGNLTLSQATDANGGTISISGGTAAAGAFSAGISGGNTAGATGITGTRLVLAGASNITLSGAADGNGGTISIVGQSTTPQTVQTQNLFDLTAAGNTAGALALVSSGTMTLAGGNGITLSQAGNAITISGSTFSQSVQTQSRFNLTISGNTSGAGALISSGVLTLAGGNNITVSQAGNALTISGPNAAGAQTGISSIAASDATFTSGQVQFTGSGIVTVRSSANQRVVIDASQSAQTQNVVDVTLDGNTAGALALVSSGTMTLAGGNNITVSQNGNAITISGANIGGAQTGISGIIASDATYTSGTVEIVGSGAITVGSGTGQRVVLSVAAQSVQPETQTFLGGISASDTLYTSGTVRFTGVGGGVTVSSNTGQRVDISVAAPVAQTGTQFSAGISGGNTAGDTGTVAGRVVLAGGNGITLSGSTNGSSETITISGITQSVESQSFGMSNIGNTSGTTGIASGGQVRFLLAGGNNVTLSQSLNGASGTITISAAAQTAESQSIGMSNIGNTSGTTGIASGAQIRMLFAGGNNITLSQSLNGASGTLTISAASQTVQTQGIVSMGVSSGGNTAGATTVNTGSRMVFVGGANITLSQTTGAGASTISIVGGAGGAGFSAGVSTGGNTAGATGVSGTQMVLVGSGVMSLSQTTGANGNTVSIMAPASSVISAVAPLSTSTNGSTISVLGPATSSLVGVSGITVSTNGSTISVIGTFPNRTDFYPYVGAPMVTGQQGQASLHIAPLHFPNLQHDRLLLGMQVSNATNSSNSITISAWAGLYSKNASSISLISSISTSTNFSGSGTVGSYSLYGGPKWLSLPWTNTITENDYYMGIVVRTTTGGAAGHSVSQLCVSKFTNSAWSGIMGAASGATDQHQLGLGVFTVSTSGMPASIAFTDINGSGSMVLRAPVFELRSGTV